MTIVPDDMGQGPVLQEAMRELEAAIHDARVAFDCIGLGEIDRASTSAVTARVAIDAAVTALQAAQAHSPLGGDDLGPGDHLLRLPGAATPETGPVHRPSASRGASPGVDGRDEAVHAASPLKGVDWGNRHDQMVALAEWVSTEDRHEFARVTEAAHTTAGSVKHRASGRPHRQLDA